MRHCLKNDPLGTPACIYSAEKSYWLAFSLNRPIMKTSNLNIVKKIYPKMIHLWYFWYNPKRGKRVVLIPEFVYNVLFPCCLVSYKNALEPIICSKVADVIVSACPYPISTTILRITCTWHISMSKTFFFSINRFIYCCEL